MVRDCDKNLERPEANQTQLLSIRDLERAAKWLKEGMLVAFPTETVYGLGASIFNTQAIASIFKVKGRPLDNPLIAHVQSIEQVHQIAVEIPEDFYLLAQSFFPGPLTVVLKRNLRVPSTVSAGLDSIALRMPSHPVALELISRVGEPLVAPSANLSGKPSSTQAKHVLEDFEGKIAAVIDGGKTHFGIESTVISLLGAAPMLLRPGAIATEQIEHVLGRPVATLSHAQGPVVSPGMKYRHYAPRAAIKIFESFETMSDHLSRSLCSSPRMLLSLHSLPNPLEGVDTYILSANEFYSLLRFADQKNYQEILILCDQSLKEHSALMNRILRSAGL